MEYLDKTFKRWQQLAAQGVTLGSREIAKLTDTVYGAKLNARYGFEAVARREPDEEGQDRFTLMIYKTVKRWKMTHHFIISQHQFTDKKARNLTWDLWTDLQVTVPWT